MTDRTCKDCRWFAQWPGFTTPSWCKEAEGVCTAPRPKLGPEPRREVHRYEGKNCPMLEVPQ